MAGGKARLSVPKKGTFPAAFKGSVWVVTVPERKRLEEAEGKLRLWYCRKGTDSSVLAQAPSPRPSTHHSQGPFSPRLSPGLGLTYWESSFNYSH